MPNSFIAVGFENWLGSFCSNIIIIYFFFKKWKIENLTRNEFVERIRSITKIFLEQNTMNDQWLLILF